MIMKKIVLKPTYLDKFKCIGIKCEDNCCQGWSIDIDKKTYKKYIKSNYTMNNKLNNKLKENIKKK